MDLVVAQHVRYSWTSDWTLVPCIGRQILNHWTTRKPSLCVCVCLIYVFTYLAVLALSCGIQYLWSSLRHAGFFLLKHAGSLVVALSISNCSLACELLVSSDQGSNPGPLHWECRVLTASAPGKLLFVVLSHIFLISYFEHLCVCLLVSCMSLEKCLLRFPSFFFFF